MAVLKLYGMTIIWYIHFTESSVPVRHALPTRLRDTACSYDEW